MNGSGNKHPKHLKEVISNLPNARNELHWDELEDQHSYNCWGFTAFYCGWKPALEWVNHATMRVMLKSLTKIVKSPQVGDIIQFRTKELTHTGIIVESEELLILHKPGNCPLETVTLTEMLNDEWYAAYGVNYSFRRPK